MSQRPSRVSSRFGALRRSSTGRLARGQSLVELALILPVLLLLVLIALDFGRVFLGWISLNNMARVGADFAATHPNADWGTPTDPEVVQYRQLMADNAGAINCVLRSTPPPGAAEPAPLPVFGPTRDVGDNVQVGLTCYFDVITPIVEIVTGNWIPMSASTTYPITWGCLTDCPTGPVATPPPPPDNCRTVPDMRDLSVAGARAAWLSAGFLPGTFDPASGDDTRTVDQQTVTLPPDAETCPSGKSFFAASVSVTLVDLETPKPTPTCEYVPDLRGMTVDEARSTWLATPLAGTFTPATGNDTNIVLGQVTTPDSDPGDCLEPTVDVEVSYGPPLPVPPPAPCLVPNFANTASDDAVGSWTAAGFEAGNLTFDKPNRLPYTVKTQTLVGGTWVACSSSIELGPGTGRP